MRARWNLLSLCTRAFFLSIKFLITYKKKRWNLLYFPYFIISGSNIFFNVADLSISFLKLSNGFNNCIIDQNFKF
jgi:hypothetical protein